VDPTRLALQVIGLADGAGLLAASSALVNP
jgi:hypothetical protein